MGKKRRALRNPQKFGAKRSYLVAHEDISDRLTETVAAIPIETPVLTEVETIVPPTPKKAVTSKTKTAKKTTSRTRKSSKTATKKTK